MQFSFIKYEYLLKSLQIPGLRIRIILPDRSGSLYPADPDQLTSRIWNILSGRSGSFYSPDPDHLDMDPIENAMEYYILKLKI